VRRRTVVARRALASSLLCTLVALAACTKDKGRPDSTASQADLPGALAKPLDSLSGEELYAFTQKLTFGGGVEQERKCKDSPECTAVRPLRTRVRIDAVDGQDSVSVSAIPAKGVVAIKAINNGPATDAMYGMKPDRNLQYFLVLLPGTDSLGRWRLEELDTTQGARRHRQVATGTFKPCWHPFVKNKVNRANFYTCADAHMSGDSLSRSGQALQGDESPMWMDCAQGCCLATSP
jgi:hypothetical protein